MSLADTQDFVADKMDEIKRCFKAGVKIAVIVRTPMFPDRDFLMTDDELPEIISLLERRVQSRPAP